MKYFSEAQRRRITITAAHIAKTGCTVREAGRHVKSSKSMVHKDATVNLRILGNQFYGRNDDDEFPKEEISYDEFLANGPYEEGKYQPGIYTLVREILDQNRAEAPIRGGKATKNKFLQERYSM